MQQLKQKEARRFMVDWIHVNTTTIKRIAYNPEIKIMYIDFFGSTTDTPYQGVPEKVFKNFSKAVKTDEFYETHIKDKYQSIEVSTECNINCHM